MIDGARTLRLLFPQWQGGADPNYRLGARLLDWLAPEPTGSSEEVAVAPDDGVGPGIEDGIFARSAILAQARDARVRIDRHRPDRLVVLGGDCGVDLAPFAYLNERYDGDLAVLWVDAHSDLLVKEIHPNAHAHVLGTLLGEGDAAFRALVARPIRPGNVMIAGLCAMPEALRIVAEVEGDIIRRRAVASAGPEDLAVTSEPVLRWLRGTGARHVAIHLDLDVLDPACFRSLLFAEPGAPAPRTDGIPAGRMSLPQVVRLLNDVAEQADVVGLGITEHLPWEAIALKGALAKLPLLGGPRG